MVIVHVSCPTELTFDEIGSQGPGAREAKPPGKADGLQGRRSHNGVAQQEI